MNLLLQRFPFIAILLAAIVLLSGYPFSARAQLTGSVAVGGQATNNVQSLDTIAPDQILMPAFQLNYDVHPSGVSTISLTASYSPNFYALNPGLSFNETSIGATGVFYLSNQDAISAEVLQNGLEGGAKPSHASHLFRMGYQEMDPLIFCPPPDPVPQPTGSSNQQSKSD